MKMTFKGVMLISFLALNVAAAAAQSVQASGPRPVPQVRSAWVQLDADIGPAAAQADSLIIVSPVKVGDKSITGKTVKGAKLEVFRNDAQMSGAAEDDAVAGDDGSFTLELKSAVAAKDVLTLKQTVGTAAAKTMTIPVTAGDLDAPTVDELRAGDTRVTGRATPGATVQVFRNNASEPVATAVASGTGDYVAFLESPQKPLAEDDIIRVNQKVGDQTSAFTEPRSVVTPFDRTKPNLIGLAPFGVVGSSQADQFNQFDPFGGFVVGYTSHQAVRFACKRLNDEAIKKEISLIRQKYAEEQGRADTNNDDRARARIAARIERDLSRIPRDECVRLRIGQAPDDRLFQTSRIDPSAPTVIIPRRVSNHNLRFQGIFQTAARKAEGMGEDSMQMETFVASRKSFDVDIHYWLERSINDSPVLWLGPYVGAGLSTALSGNELANEVVKKDGETVEPDEDDVDNDAKFFFDAGAAANFYSSDTADGNLYVQVIAGYGFYQALHGVAPGSAIRFIGKLRVFPTGLNRGFFQRGIAAPMFGVDLNAGRGDDHVKFFFGMVFNVTKLLDRFRGAPPTASLR
jgi:hypothetical protein